MAYNVRVKDACADLAELEAMDQAALAACSDAASVASANVSQMNLRARFMM